MVYFSKGILQLVQFGVDVLDGILGSRYDDVLYSVDTTVDNLSSGISKSTRSISAGFPTLITSSNITNAVYILISILKLPG